MLVKTLVCTVAVAVGALRAVWRTWAVLEYLDYVAPDLLLAVRCAILLKMQPYAACTMIELVVDLMSLVAGWSPWALRTRAAMPLLGLTS